MPLPHYLRSARLAIFVLALLSGLVATFHPARPLTTRHRDLNVTVDGVTLAGTLSTPRWSQGPFPAVIFVHGSGRATRRDAAPDIRRWIERGFAVYSYDKRGVGSSTGVYREPSSRHPEVLHELASHASAALRTLQRQPEIDAQRVGYLGLSQAGWIIPLAADVGPPPRFAILLSGPAISIALEEFYSVLTGDGRSPNVSRDLAAIRAQTDAFTGPPGYDPQPVLARVRVPSLWLLGELDLSVPTWASERVLAELQKQGLPITLVTYPGAGHNLRGPDQRPNPRIWQDIDAFLATQRIAPSR